ncbi:helix-turn-helix domain-containing protein [Streptomyces wedmorensis]
MVTAEIGSRIRRRYREGASVRTVAREFGVSKDTVQRQLPPEERRGAVDAARQRYANRSNTPDEQKLRREVNRLYRSGKSCAEVAAALGISTPMVQLRIPRQLRRTLSETASLVGRRVTARLPEREIIRRYMEGESLTALGQRYGVHASTIRRRIPQAVIRPQGPVSPAQRRGPLQLPDEQIRQRYRKGESAYSLAKAFAVSQSVIRRRIPDDEWRGRPPRKPTAVQQPKPKRRPTVRRAKLRIPHTQVLTRYRSGESASSIARAAGVACMTIVHLIPADERRTNEQANRRAPDFDGVEIRRLRAQGQTVREIAAMAGLSVKTVRKRRLEP